MIYIGHLLNYAVYFSKDHPVIQKMVRHRSYFMIVNPQNTHLLVNEWNVPDVTTLCRTWSCNQNTQSLVCLRKRIVRGLTSVTREIWSCRHRNLKTLSNSENGLSPNHKQINIRYLPIIWNNTMISLLTRLNGCENKFFLFIFFYNACSFIYKQTIH